MKLRLLALAAAAVTSNAFALSVADTNDAATLQIYVGGASASKGVIGGLFSQNCDRGAGAGTATDTLTIYQSKVGSAAADAADTSAGSSYNTYSCSLISGNDFSLPAGTKVAFHKRDKLGSIYGTYPVAQNLKIEFMTISDTSCTADALVAGTTPTSKCTDVNFNHAPDGGVSDEEPAVFLAPVNMPATILTDAGAVAPTAFTNADFDSTPKTLFQTGFGLFVSAPLYTALQTAQSTTGTPNFPSVVASSMLRLGFVSSTLGWKALNVANPTNQVNICRRDIGSGTQAASNIFFLQNPLNGTVTVSPLLNSNSSSGLTTNSLANIANTAGKLFVFEAASTGQVKDCLNAANTASAYAIGVMSLENGSAAGYKLVNIDGAVASRDSFKAGNYGFFMESTLQVNKNAGATQKSFLNTLATQAQSPDNLAAAGGNNIGYAALFNAPAIAAGANGNPAKVGCNGIAFGTGTTNQVTFCSRVKKTGNNFDVPRLAK